MRQEFDPPESETALGPIDVGLVDSCLHGRGKQGREVIQEDLLISLTRNDSHGSLYYQVSLQYLQSSLVKMVRYTVFSMLR